jgi:hypothetical protein
MMSKVLFLIALVFVVWSCSEVKEDELEQSDLVIKTGTVCGWCSQNDTLIISGKTFRYVNFIQCSNTNPSVKKTGQLATTETELLLNELDFQEFKKLDLNSCNVCFDGCDDWISIKNGAETHTIRFSRNDPKLQPIKSFVDQLSAIKARYEAGN